jgi:hypothetical protein
MFGTPTNVNFVYKPMITILSTAEGVMRVIREFEVVRLRTNAFIK